MKKIRKFQFDEVESIEEYFVDDIDVYNLSVEEDESYCANRIAVHNCTEMAAIYEAGNLAEHEAEAMESMKTPDRAQYFVFTGGQCKWCSAHHGVLTRLVPRSIVSDTSNDSLKSMGINDPNTDIAIWVGKNNVGFRETKAVHGWRVTVPAHPNNTAHMEAIDLKTEYYNPKSGRVEQRPQKYKHVPQAIEYAEQTKEEKDYYKKPKKIGNNLVQVADNVYEAVPNDQFNRKLEAWRKDTSLPIPVPEKSPDYKRIFEAAT